MTQDNWREKAERDYARLETQAGWTGAAIAILCCAGLGVILMAALTGGF